MSPEEASAVLDVLAAALTRSQLSALRAVYPRPRVLPGLPHESLLYQAGAASVVDDLVSRRRADSR